MTKAKFEEFLEAQDTVYLEVIDELAASQKKTHWMWFVFPQLAGLGTSTMARKFAISSLEEAQAYLLNPVLGPRLHECTRLLLASSNESITQILGHPDDRKFHSCMSLFAIAAPDENVFTAALEKYFGGKLDPATLDLLQRNR